MDWSSNPPSAPRDQRNCGLYGNFWYVWLDGREYDEFTDNNLGTMTGLGTYFKEAKPDVYRIAYVPLTSSTSSSNF